MANVLIVDDEKNIRTHLATYVRGVGHGAETAEDAAAALAALDRGAVDIVLSDVRMAGMDGLALLREMRRRQPDVVVVLMTAYATVPQAVEAMRAGAYDYLVKPFSLDQIGLLLQRVLEVLALRRENRVLRSAIDQPALLDSSSPSMQRVLATARQVAESSVTVLLTGESGTGKNVLAAAIHSWSARAAAPFITISCTTLAEHLLESELFGHMKGAFTSAWKDKPGRLEAAGGGTVFLDEVGELPAELQAKLLRFLEEHRFERVGSSETIEVDARIIAATNRDLDADVRVGRFREDLYFRLNVVAIRLPPLRERREDLPALIDHVLATLCARHRRAALQLSNDARAALLAYPWPGNIRELVNALERAVVLSRGDLIQVEDLPDRLAAPPRVAAAPVADPSLSLEDIERRHIQQVLTDAATLEEAAARLGINPTTLWRKRKRYGIE
ncbi:MAG TPA: sigma-54 dependent transcriptional regulator [Candidatus Binatia bacterium]|nr:sigma-54 dependent transcriptional regulator [Candidatus Binatia bacterium]